MAGNELQAVRRDANYFSCVECSALWKHWGPLGHHTTAPSLDSEWELNSLSAFVPAGGNSSERQPPPVGKLLSMVAIGPIQLN